MTADLVINKLVELPTIKAKSMLVGTEYSSTTYLGNLEVRGCPAEALLRSVRFSLGSLQITGPKKRHF